MNRYVVAMTFVIALTLTGGQAFAATATPVVSPNTSPCGSSCGGGGSSDEEYFYLSSGPNAFSGTVSDETLSGFVYFTWGGTASQNSSTRITDTGNHVSAGSYTGTGYAYYG